MSEKKISITSDCALVVTRRVLFPPDVVIRYNGPAGDWEIGEEETEADIDADTARAMIALLVDAFGPDVLPDAVVR